MSLSLKNISKEFLTTKKTIFNAVDNISLDFKNNQFYTLLGPSGCGKTTLLRMIAGFEHPTRGEIIYKSKNIVDTPAHQRGFPMVFQSYALFPHMKVTENIAYGLELKKMPKKDIKTKLEKIIALLDLDHHAEKYPHQMSGGQQQRVALARALVMEPEIILFDEPLSNLDAKLRIHMRNEIRSLQKRLGLMAIYVTHDQEEAMAISDQIIVLNKGRIEQMGSPVEIYHTPSTEFVAKFIGNANIIDIEKVGGHEYKILGASYNLADEIPPSKLASKAVIRAEALRFTPQGKHDAVVTDSIYLGPSIHYTLDCGKNKISITTPWNCDIPTKNAGERVKFELDPRKIHFIAIEKSS